jgi:hypothetical protein
MMGQVVKSETLSKTKQGWPGRSGKWPGRYFGFEGLSNRDVATEPYRDVFTGVPRTRTIALASKRSKGRC